MTTSSCWEENNFWRGGLVPRTMLAAEQAKSNMKNSVGTRHPGLPFKSVPRRQGTSIS